MEKIEIEELNSRYKKLSPEERLHQIYKDFDKILVTSSFGTSSAFLLSRIAKVNRNQVIHFVDTTYHFPETIQYKEELANYFGLKVADLRQENWKNEFTRQYEMWKRDQDLCCSVNKVEPVKQIRGNYQIWISGLMAWQTPHRANLQIFEDKNDIVKFNPLIDIQEDAVRSFLLQHEIPVHPLQKYGFSSIGCIHCTKKGEGREGRWAGKEKTECGLHL